MVSANNLLLIYLFLEIQGVITTILIGLIKNSNLVKEALIKFFIFNAIASAFIGFGLSIIYSYYGTLNITQLSLLCSLNKILISGFLFFWIGFLFKLAIVPFHF